MVTAIYNSGCGDITGSVEGYTISFLKAVNVIKCRCHYEVKMLVLLCRLTTEEREERGLDV